MKQRLFTAIKMYDNSVAFVRLPPKLKLENVSRFEYAYGSNFKRVQVIMYGGTVIVCDVHARIPGGIKCEAA